MELSPFDQHLINNRRYNIKKKRKGTEIYNYTDGNKKNTIVAKEHTCVAKEHTSMAKEHTSVAKEHTSVAYPSQALCI